MSPEGAHVELYGDRMAAHVAGTQQSGKPTPGDAGAPEPEQSWRRARTCALMG